MLSPIKTPSTTRVLGAPLTWDENKHGECVGLPVVDGGDGVIYSYWRVPFRERLAILFGKPILLGVAGNSHPPVNLSAE